MNTRTPRQPLISLATEAEDGSESAAMTHIWTADRHRETTRCTYSLRRLAPERHHCILRGHIPLILPFIRRRLVSGRHTYIPLTRCIRMGWPSTDTHLYPTPQVSTFANFFQAQWKYRPCVSLFTSVAATVQATCQHQLMQCEEVE